MLSYVHPISENDSGVLNDIESNLVVSKQFSHSSTSLGLNQSQETSGKYEKREDIMLNFLKEHTIRTQYEQTEITRSRTTDMNSKKVIVIKKRSSSLDRPSTSKDYIQNFLENFFKK